MVQKLRQGRHSNIDLDEKGLVFHIKMDKSLTSEFCPALKASPPHLDTYVPSEEIIFHLE